MNAWLSSTLAQFGGHAIPEGVQSVPAAPSSSPTQTVLWAVLGVILLVIVAGLAIRVQRER